MKRLADLYRVFCTVLVGALLVSLVLLSGCSQWEQPFRLVPNNEGVALYHEVWHLVDRDFVDASKNQQDWLRWKHRYDDVIKTKDDAYTAINSMLASLNDPYTRFLPPKAAADQDMNIDARLFGVGIQIAEKDHQVVVISPIEDSPADKAGIRPLDKLVRINQEPVANLSLEDCVSRIRGPKGTPVTLTMLRDGQKKVFKLVRDEIVIKTVFSEPISSQIGYIRLSSFISQDSAREMRAMLEKMKNKPALILDIRGNNGGLLPNALEISDMFLDGGDIVSVVDRHKNRKVFRDQQGQVYSGPVVLLVDSGSASASEILSGALKDNDRATLIGEQTFGKGLVQKINPLSDGSELNLTISKYYTPDGSDINKKGIAPDISVKLTAEDFAKARDPQKLAAIDFLKKTLQERVAQKSWKKAG